jgi:hypothetical protein
MVQKNSSFNHPKIIFQNLTSHSFSKRLTLEFSHENPVFSQTIRLTKSQHENRNSTKFNSSNNIKNSVNNIIFQNFILVLHMNNLTPLHKLNNSNKSHHNSPIHDTQCINSSTTHLTTTTTTSNHEIIHSLTTTTSFFINFTQKHIIFIYTLFDIQIQQQQQHNYHANHVLKQNNNNHARIYNN